MQHAALGASSAHRWIACPGSVALSADMPDTSSEYAIEGTAAHALAERCLRKHLDADVWLESEINGVLVTEEMCEAVQVFVDYVREKSRNARLYIETRFDLSALHPPAPMFGTSDVCVWDPRERVLEIVDYKHGRGYAVSAKANPQLRYYALGAVLKLKVRPGEIITTIVQPRAPHAEGIIRSDSFDWYDLIAFKTGVLLPAARRTLLPDAPLKVGPHCQFCKALAVCPAQHAHAIVVAQSEFSVEAPRSLPAPVALSQEQLLLVMQKMEYVEDWFKSIRTYVQQQLEAGVVVPGWKLVAKRATRKWVDDDQLLEWIGTSTDIGAEVYTQKLKSPAQVEALLKKSKIKLPEALISKVSSGFNLAQSADARPALQPLTAANEFAAAPWEEAA